VNVVWQYNECVDVERVSLTRAARGFTQGLDLVRQKTTATIEEICREEPACSGDKGTTIIWHAAGYQSREAAQSSDCALRAKVSTRTS